MRKTVFLRRQQQRIQPLREATNWEEVNETSFWSLKDQPNVDPSERQRGLGESCRWRCQGTPLLSSHDLPTHACDKITLFEKYQAVFLSHLYWNSLIVLEWLEEITLIARGKYKRGQWYICASLHRVPPQVLKCLLWEICSRKKLAKFFWAKIKHLM